MNDIIYPKSSCNKCIDTYPDPDSGSPSNMSVLNCNFASDCVKDRIFKVERNNYQKKKASPSYTNINPISRINGYYKNVYDVENTACGTKGFGSTNPRLISASHNGQKLELDLPPTDTDIKLKDIYTDPRMVNYGQKYNNYSDIKVGQIMYYVDNDIKSPFFNQLFTNESVTVGTNYIDPMSSLKPEYKRIPVKEFPKRSSGCLSFIDDTSETREDLLSLQMRPNNRKRYETRWY